MPKNETHLKMPKKTRNMLKKLEPAEKNSKHAEKKRKNAEQKLDTIVDPPTIPLNHFFWGNPHPNRRPTLLSFLVGN